jgi:hypothetical protein
MRETLAQEGEVAVDLDVRSGEVHADLTVGAKVGAAQKLAANQGLCFQGMNLVGKGFRLTPEEVHSLGYDTGALPEVIKPHRNARDMMQAGEDCFVIDLFGLTAEQARTEHPALYQWLFDRVKPERDHNNDAQRRRDWWLFGRSNAALRLSWAGLPQIILTPETSKHRVFAFQPLPFCPDHKLYAICSADPNTLGVLSSTVHAHWALRAGGTLEDRPTWTNTTCFMTYPFPATTEAQQARIRALAEQLDAHRKRQQAAHATLTLTGMYNVLEKLKTGEALTPKEKTIHEQGLVSVLKTLHDELDAAVLDAYGWGDLAAPLAAADPATREAAAEALLVRLVALNAERAAEEAKGHIRWLRPEYQHPVGTPQQAGLPEAGASAADEASAATPISAVPAARQPWPPTLPEQVAAVARVLADAAAPLTEPDLAACFTGKGPWKKRLPQIIDTLEALGRVRRDTTGALLAQ